MSFLHCISGFEDTFYKNLQDTELPDPFLFFFFFVKKNKKNFMAPFYGWGSTPSRLEPLQGGSLLFTTKFQKLVLILSTLEG